MGRSNRAGLPRRGAPACWEPILRVVLWRSSSSAGWLEHAVLVGHSYSGIVVTGASDRLCAAGGTSVELVRGLLAQGDPRAAVFAGPGWQLHELATGHWPMFSEPALLSELLARIASGPGG